MKPIDTPKLIIQNFAKGNMQGKFEVIREAWLAFAQITKLKHHHYRIIDRDTTAAEED
jgi:hypothetical protein